MNESQNIITAMAGEDFLPGDPVILTDNVAHRRTLNESGTDYRVINPASKGQNVDLATHNTVFSIQPKEDDAAAIVFSDVERELKRWLIDEFGAIDGGDENNNEYLSIVAGGIKKEGEPYPAYMTSLGEAVRYWKLSVVAESKKGKNLKVKQWPYVFRDSKINWLYQIQSRMVFE